MSVFDLANTREHFLKTHFSDPRLFILSDTKILIIPEVLKYIWQKVKENPNTLKIRD